MKIQPQHTICIQGGHVFDPSENLDAIMDVYIENDCIVALGKAPEGFKAEETINAKGKMIFPGFIDTNAFLSEPGFTQKGTINSENSSSRTIWHYHLVLHTQLQARFRQLGTSDFGTRQSQASRFL